MALNCWGEGRYYIYTHIGFDNKVLYVGKGSGRRAYSWTSRKYPRDIVKDIIILPMRYTDNMSALRAEEIITQHYKDLGQCKFNELTGAKGVVITESQKECIRNSHKKRWDNMTKQQRQEFIDSNLRRKGVKNGFAKTYKVTLPNGEEKTFITRDAISSYFKGELSPRMVKKIISLKEEYKPRNKKFKKFYGLKIERVN